MDWLYEIRNNANNALRKLMELYSDECIQWLTKQFPISREDAEEINQAALVVLYDNVMQGKITNLTAHIKTYYFSIAKNLYFQFARNTNKKVAADVNTLLLDYVDEEYQEVPKEDIAKIGVLLNSLGDPCKSILQLVYYEAMSMENIAILMNYKNADTVKNLKYKCLKRLQKSFHE